MMHRQRRVARASLIEIQPAAFWPLGALGGTGVGDASCLSFKRVVGIAEKMFVLMMLVFWKGGAEAEFFRMGRPSRPSTFHR